MKMYSKRRRPALGRRPALAGLILAATLATPMAGQDLDQRDRQRLFNTVKPAVVLVYSIAEADIVIPRDNNSALRLNTGISGWGSGWIVTPDGFVVTNGHVVEMYHESNETELRQELLYQALEQAGVFNQVDEETGRRPTEAEAVQQMLEIYPRADITLKKDLVVILQNGRVLDASVREYSPPIVNVPGKASVPGIGSFTSGRDVAILKVAARDLPTMKLGDSDASAIGEEIFVAGYPGAADLPNIDAASSLQASFTRGQVSSLKVAVGGSDLIQVDAAASKGNSGGPVFNRNGEVLGILTMGEGESFNFAVTSNTIREFFRASGAVVGESLFDRSWDRALTSYYAGNYPAAIEGFDEVLRVMPDLPDALNLRRISMTEREAGRTDPPPDSAPVLPGGDVPVIPPDTPPVDDGGIPPWLMAVMALGVVFVGAGLFMRRKPATALAGGGTSTMRTSGSGAAAATVAAGASATAHLRVTSGPLQGNRFEIGPDGLRVGRDPVVCQIVLSEASVSREHAVIRRTGGALSIKNLSGTNPTYVNDRSIQEAALSTGDTVKIGDSVFTVEA